MSIGATCADHSCVTQHVGSDPCHRGHIRRAFLIFGFWAETPPPADSGIALGAKTLWIGSNQINVIIKLPAWTFEVGVDQMLGLFSSFHHKSTSIRSKALMFQNIHTCLVDRLLSYDSISIRILRTFIWFKTKFISLHPELNEIILNTRTKTSGSLGRNRDVFVR